MTKFRWHFDWGRFGFLVMVIGGLLGAGCASLPQRELAAYRRAFDQARAQSEHVTADYAAARQARSNLMAVVALKSNASPNSRTLAGRLGLDAFDVRGLVVPDDIEVRLKAWNVIGAYNEALAALASGAKSSEVEGAVNGFLSSLQNLPIKEVARMAGDAVPYVGIAVELVEILQKEIEAHRFRQAVLKAEQPMKVFVGLLRKDAVLFRNYRVTLLNERFAEQEIMIFDREDRFRIITAAHPWTATNEVNALITQVNANRILAAGVETFPAITAAAPTSAPASAGQQEAELSELRTLADAIEREASAARATVAQLSAYHELMRQTVLLITELERKLGELADAARRSTGHLPSVDQLQAVIFNVRLAYQIYNETK